MVKFEISNKQAILYVEGVREGTFSEDEIHVAKSVLNVLRKRNVLDFEFVTDHSLEV